MKRLKHPNVILFMGACTLPPKPLHRGPNSCRVDLCSAFCTGEGLLALLVLVILKAAFETQFMYDCSSLLSMEAIRSVVMVTTCPASGGNACSAAGSLHAASAVS